MKVKAAVAHEGEPAFRYEEVEHFKVGRLPFDKMLKTYTLEDINQAVADQHAGLCVKPVLIPKT